MFEAHSTDHGRGLGELDVAIVDDLNLVAPRVEEVEPRARQDLDRVRLEDCSGRGLVIDDETEVSSLVRRLTSVLR